MPPHGGGMDLFMNILLSFSFLLLGAVVGICIYTSMNVPKRLTDENELLISEVGIKIKDIINERNYFDVNRDMLHLSESVNYTVYTDNENYYAYISEDEVYKFIKIRNGFIYLGTADSYGIAETCLIFGSNSFYYPYEYEPQYDSTAGFSFENEFNYMLFAESLKNDINQYLLNSTSNDYTLFVKNQFTWDKSNYSSDGKRIGIIVKYDNDEILETSAYQNSDGWHIDLPGYKTILNQNPQYEYIFNRYVNTALYITDKSMTF